MSLALVVNGRARGVKKFFDKIDLAAYAGKANIHITDSLEELLELGPYLQEHATHVVPVGGDGTIVHVLNSMDLEAPLPTFGVLAAGTGNQLEADLDLDRRYWNDLDAYVEGISEMQTLTLPLIRVVGRQGEVSRELSYVSAGAGISARAIALYDASPLPSFMGYAAAGFTGLFEGVVKNPDTLGEGIFDEDATNYTREEASRLVQDLSEVSVGTIGYFGLKTLVLPYAEQAREAGQFHARVQSSRSMRNGWMGVLRGSAQGLFKGREQVPGFEDWQASSLSITYPEPAAVHVGGEPLGAYSEVTFKMGARVRFALPKR